MVSSFFADGSFLWLSRREGNTHLWHARADGELVDLSPGPWDVTKIVGVDAGHRFVWYQAARPNPMERRLFRVDLSTGDTLESHPRRRHPLGRARGFRSSSGHHIEAGAPPRRWVMDNSGARGAEIPVEHPIPQIDYADHRFVEVKADDGIVLNAMLLLPPEFDESMPLSGGGLHLRRSQRAGRRRCVAADERSLQPHSHRSRFCRLRPRQPGIGGAWSRV